ncbi:MAG: DUF4258 domain-containing protein [Calditrichaeota bacterium]|nr:DUF4258 domain-containing protein [Calditrichota bacterium]MCB0270060.1 DUF4258 domain-containing protein [Calditrichota bacterium]MCB0287850.1 DUF4258 domain-containing protein [Calditrichota bacterium]MCB0300302.1 DUF4258 domain-containing protein [Calditrichota bacterium]MCB9067892.1 DUF4258 domain-containing protein [Calditrichia bacterium]
MKCPELKFSGHALQRMFERRITENDVFSAIKNGEVIGEYPDDKPCPSFLLLSIVEQRPIHILIALCAEKKVCIIVTVYEPDSNIWHIDFKTRRKQ